MADGWVPANQWPTGIQWLGTQELNGLALAPMKSMAGRAGPSWLPGKQRPGPGPQERKLRKLRKLMAVPPGNQWLGPAGPHDINGWGWGIQWLSGGQWPAANRWSPGDHS